MEVRGREIRTSAIDRQYITSGGIPINNNANIFIRCGGVGGGESEDDMARMMNAPSNDKIIQCNSKELPRLVKPNDLIYVDDGKIILLVSDCEMVSNFHNVEENLIIRMVFVVK